MVPPGLDRLGQLTDLQAEGNEQFLPFIDKQATELGLPEDIPPDDERRHLALLMTMMGLRRPDGQFFDQYDHAHLAGDQRMFFERALGAIRGKSVADRFEALTMLQSMVLHGLGPGARYVPRNRKSLHGNRKTPRTIGDREHVSFGRSGDLPRGEDEAEARLAIKAVGAQLVISSTREVLLSLAQEILGATYATCQEAGNRELASFHLVLANRDRLDALSRIWALIFSLKVDGLDISHEVAQIRVAFQQMAPFGSMGVEE